jgi:hypothetical protein
MKVCVQGLGLVASKAEERLLIEHNAAQNAREASGEMRAMSHYPSRGEERPFKTYLGLIHHLAVAHRAV